MWPGWEKQEREHNFGGKTTWKVVSWKTGNGGSNIKTYPRKTCSEDVNRI